MRRIRTINQVVQEIHTQDPNSAITDNYIRTLIRAGELQYFLAGSKYLLDLDQVINYFNCNGTKKS